MHQVIGAVVLFGRTSGCSGTGMDPGPTQQIAIKELVSIVVACAVWGSQWRNKHVLFRCDNMAAVR